MSRLEAADKVMLCRALREEECFMCPVCKQKKKPWVTIHTVIERRYETLKLLKADAAAVKALLRQVLRFGQDESEKIREKKTSLTFDRIRDRYLRASYLDAEACCVPVILPTPAALPVLSVADKDLIRRAVITPGRRHICIACKQATKPWVTVYLLLKRNYGTLSNLDADQVAVKALFCQVLGELESYKSDTDQGKRRLKKHAALTFERIRDRFLREVDNDDSGFQALLAAVEQTALMTPDKKRLKRAGGHLEG